jgi:magnesium transporter
MGKNHFLNLDFLNLPINRDLFQVKAKKIGLPPGTLTHVGEQKTERPVLSSIDYDQSRFDTRTDITIEDAAALKETATVSWINLSGIHDINHIAEIGKHFDIHPLALEDILNTRHRPKVEETDDYSLIILKMLFFDDKSQSITTEQVSLILGARYVLTFQEREGDVFDGVRDRLQRSSGRIRQRGSDYLAYALIDSIVDSYFHILEKVGDRLVELEEGLTEHPDQGTLKTIHHFKRELISLRKSIWPMREVVAGLQREESTLIDATTYPYLRDLYDHTIQVIDTTEIYRDTLSSLLDLYMSSISHRMNEIMKVLTIMATIFIPLTFIAGIYGMNFEYMPELKWRGGYFMVWGVMISCVVAMLIYFRRNKWL